ncbi:MAG: hypothetical protein P4L79_17230 [Legionella sp.]|uniref:hypothetical protein n=1 Tax=Legionella sp. TaxID=459 RepID=UPI0028420B02|nr:hypothetical protein [Legionella sp.]
MWKKIIFGSTIISAALLTGCASVYVPPTEGPQAKISEFDPSSVDVAIYDNALSCEGVPHPLHVDKNQFVSIPANKPITMDVTRKNGSSYPDRSDVITFIPEAGKKYSIQNKITEIRPGIIRTTLRVLKVIDLDNGEAIYLSTRYYKRERAGYAGRCIDHQVKNFLQNIK